MILLTRGTTALATSTAAMFRPTRMLIGAFALPSTNTRFITLSDSKSLTCVRLKYMELVHDGGLLGLSSVKL